MNTRITIFSLLLAASQYMNAAETVLLDENFNDDFRESFSSWYDGDALTPHESIASLFYSSALEGTAPWWTVRDSKESPDKFMASHSYYQTPGTSDDWLISVPLVIDTPGYILEFDAQSVNVRGAQYLSDLSIFVTEGELNEAELPAEPTYNIPQVPWGNDPDNCEGDWTRYNFCLDQYAGKTVRISFVNRNTDKDIVCVDNVKIYRNDPAELLLTDSNIYTTDKSTMVCAHVNIGAKAVYNWQLELICGTECIKTWSGDKLDANTTETFDAELLLPTGETTGYTFVFKADDSATLSISGEVTQLSYLVPHRIFMEETTSLHCGNCPVGMYTMESLLEDDVLGEYVVPVSVHIASLGYDPMATADYYSKLPISSQAPLVFVERNKQYDGFMSVDGNYDPTNPATFGYRIAQRVATPATIGIEVTADWVIQGNDTIAVSCEATIRPAVNIKDKEYRVAFILTENNVGLDRNRYWVQDNYMSGVNYESRCDGWCDLGQYVSNARYHDVARAISAYHGHLNSLPTSMMADEQYSYSIDLSIPDTNYDSNGVHMSDPIKCSFCEVTAILIDHETGLVVNAARVPMSENATIRFKVSDLLGINDITVDTDDSESNAVYYDITGRRVMHPQPGGLYIRHTPHSSTKVIK